ncbi:MAG TPA: shikimate dehydrogenase [Candidatus Nanopelagicales bacterium]
MTHAAGLLRRAAVLGSPIVHSLSPTLHRAAYRQLGLAWQYDAFEVDEAGLAAFLDGCGPEWAGLSLTMPLKRAVLPLLDEAWGLVGLVGAANTVVLGADGRRVGHNTDVPGIVAALRELGAEPGPALVLGAGATAASTLAALASMGCHDVVVAARRPAAVAPELGALAEQLGVALRVRGWPAHQERLPDRAAASIVVCTAPAAAADSLLETMPAGAPGVLLDVAYAPWPRPLVRRWRAAGGMACAGDVMLLHQAAAQVALMTGCEPDVEVMRAALAAELACRQD